jgi:hypothetical protein
MIIPRKRTIAELRFAERAGELAKVGLEERFERIYSTNLWSDSESRSGVGSRLDSTRVLRAELPLALRQLEARALLDVPCGDFTWMEQVDLSGIEYIGGDIVCLDAYADGSDRAAQRLSNGEVIVNDVDDSIILGHGATPG